jgi:hypothetical protein
MDKKEFINELYSLWMAYQELKFVQLLEPLRTKNFLHLNDKEFIRELHKAYGMDISKKKITRV